jgi:DNA-binding NtrC family response regulator
MPAVLYVDDEVAIQRAVRLWLERYGLTVHTAASTHAARDLLAEHAVAGVFIDVWLEDGSGVELYDWLRVARPALALHVAFVTGDPSASTTRHQLVATGRPVLAKPFDLDALRDLAVEWTRGA